MRYAVLLLVLAGTLCDAAEIDRKTFAVSLPEGWTEDTQSVLHDPDSYVDFENAACTRPESVAGTFFSVMVQKKREGWSLSDDFLQKPKEALEKWLPDAKSTDLTKWAKYGGKGVEREGNSLVLGRYRLLVFGFEHAGRIYLIMEANTPSCAGDFAQIRQTFKVK